LRRAIGLAGVLVVGCYLGLRYSPREFLTLLLGLGAAIIVASLAMIALYPEKGIMHATEEFAGLHEGRWRGVFLHKNRLGGMMAMTIVAAAGWLALRGTRTGLAALVLLCAIAVLLPAESTTALLACIAGLLTLAAARLYHQTHVTARTALPALGPLLLLSVCLAAYQAVENANYVKPNYRPAANTLAPGEEHVILHRPGFSRDVGATGRFKTWRQCWERIQERPLTGYGYGTFWRDGGPAEAIWAKTRFRMPHAHNGWLDLGLRLGIPGLLLGAGWMLWLGWRLLHVIWYHNGASASSAYAVPLLGLFTGINVINLGESVLFRQHDLLSALIASIALYASMLTVNTTPQQAPGRHERAPQ
jgi:O-antigen ligase